MVVPLTAEFIKSSVNQIQIHQVKTKKVYLIAWIEDIIALKVQKDMKKARNNNSVHISPKSLYSLIVH